MIKPSNLPPSELWRLASPYWKSPERGRGALVLVLLLAATAGGAGLAGWFSGFTKDFYSSLEKRDAAAFWHLCAIVFGATAFTAVVGAADQWLRQWLQIHWRRSLTQDLFNRWLNDNTFYRIERRQSIDNADQRIADDAKAFVENTIELGLQFLQTLAILFVMGVVLWKAATPVTFGPVTIPGYLFFAAVVWGTLQVGLVHWAGRRLAPLTVEQQHVDADFRFALAQQRDAAEQIALYKGAAVESQRLSSFFDVIWFNWGRLMANYVPMNFTSQVLANVTSYITPLLLAPKIFSGEVDFGSVMQVMVGFGAVSGSIGWFALSYARLVQWSAITRRLIGLNRAIDEPESSGVDIRSLPQSAVQTRDLTLALPHGETLAAIGDWSIDAGERWLIRGPSGAGKSTLLRAVAGIWPYGKGTITVPAKAKVMFLPQKSYIPFGTLKEALCYPAASDSIDDETCTQALRECRLPHLVDELHSKARWHHRLSGGEQQRLAIARVLLVKPDILFLDEATSALDNATEAALHELLKERLPQITLVSIAHQPTLDRFHEHALDLRADHTVSKSALPSSAGSIPVGAPAASSPFIS